MQGGALLSQMHETKYRRLVKELKAYPQTEMPSDTMIPK